MPKNVIQTYWKSILVIFVILVLSIMPLPESDNPIKFKNIDKLVHCMMYLGLGTMLYLDYHRNENYEKRLSFVYIIFFAILYGGFIEILQQYCTKNRSSEWLDWASDIVGILLGIVVGIFYLRRISKDE